MTAQEMTLQHRLGPLVGYRALLVAGLIGLASIACGEDLEITNAPANVVAAGTINGPVQGCPRIPASTSTSSTDVSDAGVGGDTTDSQPAPTGTMISRSDAATVIPYLLQDPEGDDQSVKVQVCQWDGQQASQCGVAVQARGGDGSTFVPTTPAGACILHLFHWDVGCGRFVGTNNPEPPSRAMIDSVDQPLVARVSIVGSDETSSQTEPFTLDDIGFEALPECK
jgi:hypothetical protein